MVVAIPTFRRADLLPDLVHSVQRQADGLDRSVRVLVIDNDPERSAAATVAGLEAEYASEPRPGIANVRQHALESTRDHELLVMIDDDVQLEERWLVELLDCWEQHRPTVVMGYVRYVWPDSADPWLVAGGFLRRNHPATGTRLEELATGNVLIDVSQVRRLDVSFDRSLGLAGGEDTLFGRAVVAGGGTIVACSDSVVRDEIPVERLNVDFVRRRTLAHGQGRTFLELEGLVGVNRDLHRARALLMGAVRWAVFTATWRTGKLLGNLEMEAVGRRRAWFAAGRMRGALGERGAEYARPRSA